MEKYIELINKLFESRIQANVYHLQSSEYARHIALEEYYSGILPIIDELVEVWQGQYGELLKGYDIIKELDENESRDNVIEYFKNIFDWIVDNRNDIIDQKDVHLQAILDDAVNLGFKTIYKLTFLK